MKLKITMLAAALFLTTAAHAQERTAGSTLDTQMTWSSLSAKIGQVDGKIGGVKSLVDQTIVCAQKGMVYAPGGSGLDAQGCKNAAVDLTTINNAITTLTNNLNKVMVCNAKSMIYAPTTAGRDAQDCVSTGGGFKVGMIVNSINGANGFPPNTDLTAGADLFISASSYGGGGESCPISGYVNGVMVANDYAIRYSSGIAFMVPKGQKWRVNAAGGNCSGRQANISVLPLN